MKKLKIPAGFVKYSWLILEIGLSIFIFSYILSRFVFFMSSYGDSSGYLVYGQVQTFLFGGYQPTYPHFVYLIFRIFNDPRFIFYIQIILYILVILIVRFKFSKDLGSFAALFLSTFLLINVREYFYISNVLTEVLNLFLYFAGFALFIKTFQLLQENPISPSKRLITLAFLFLCFLTLILIGLDRSSNLLFLLFLSLGLVFLKKYWPLTTMTGLVLVVLIGYNLSLLKGDNNVGPNLFQFIYQSCIVAHPQKSCTSEVFTGPETPKFSEWYYGSRSLGGITQQFPNQFSPEFTKEMGIAYTRLLFYNPTAYFYGVWWNWRQQVTSTQYAIYPEDPNLKTFNRNKKLSILGSVSTNLSIVASIASIFLVPYGIWCFFSRTIVDQDKMILAFLIAWIVAELFASNILGAQLYAPDTARMRLHYETQSLMLGLFIIKLKLLPLFIGIR